MSNVVYIATSLDGFIADKVGNIDWLESIPNPNNKNFGWEDFINGVDAIVMGRNTFEAVLGFGIDWPYPKIVFVLSHKKGIIPKELKDRVELLEGPPDKIVSYLNEKGYKKLYIDGANVIQNFLKEDLIDELIITRIPILLGGGVSLFGNLPNQVMFKHVSTELFLNEIVMSHYKRNREDNR